MRYVIVVVALIFTAACGQSPTSPSPNPPPPTPPIRTVEFRVVVYGLDQSPLASLPVTLRVSDQRFDATTNAAGLARWRIVPGLPVTVFIQGPTSMLELTFPRQIDADEEWGISVPLCNTRTCR
jgi:hypothetical protein